MPKNSRKAPPRQTQNKLVLAQEMDVADSMEATEDSIIIPAPPETVSKVSSSQCSNSFANYLDPTKASKGNAVEQLQRQFTLLELKLADPEYKLAEMERVRFC